MGRALFFVFSIWYLNRFLGVEAKGTWTALFSLFGILSVCSNMGFEVWLSRASASSSVSSRRAIRFLFEAKGLLWIPCLAVGAVIVTRNQYPVGLTLPFGLALIFDGIGVAQQAVFEGKRKTVSMAVMSFLKSGGFALLALSVLLFPVDPHLPLFAWLFALTLLIRVGVGWRSWRLLPNNDTPLPAGARREFLLMGAYTLVTVLYFKIDAVMLADLAGERITGNYGNAYDFVEGALFISAAAGSVLYPRLVNAQEHERRGIFDVLFKLILVIGAAGIAGIWVVGIPLGRLLAGDNFAEAVPSLTLLAMGLPFMFGNGLLSRWLFSTGREKFALQTAALLAVFNIIGNWILIPRYGAEGASVMTLATEGILFFFWVLKGRRAVPLLLFWAGLMIPVALVAYLQFKLGEPFAALLLLSVVFGPLLWVHLRAVHRFPAVEVPGKGERRTPSTSVSSKRD